MLQQYVCKYCVVCSPCVLLVEYVCKYSVNMCVNTVGRCVALHATNLTGNGSKTRLNCSM